MDVEVLLIAEEIILQGGVTDAYTGNNDCPMFANRAVSFEHRTSFSVCTIKNEE